MNKFHKRLGVFLLLLTSASGLFAREFTWTGGAGDNLIKSYRNWNLNGSVAPVGSYPGSDGSQVDSAFITIGGNLKLIDDDSQGLAVLRGLGVIM